MKNLFLIASFAAFLVAADASASVTVKNCDEDVGCAVVDQYGIEACFVQELAVMPYSYEPRFEIQTPIVYATIEAVEVKASISYRQDAERIRLCNADFVKSSYPCESLVYFDDHPKG